MACYKLTSCTAGNSTILWSSDPGFGSVISPVSLSNHGGTSVSYIVEVVEAPCNCQPTDPTVTTAYLIFSSGCTTPYLCYKLQDCQDPQGAFIYVNNNLNPYIVSGQKISIAEYPGICFNVFGVTSSVECDNALPTTITATCVEPCTCQTCYQIQNCETLTTVVINYSGPLNVGNVIKPTPAPPNAGANCWTVLGPTSCTVNPTPLVITSVTIEPDCIICTTPPPPCYKLTSCDGQTVLYTNQALSPTTYVQSALYPGKCFYVELYQGTCTNPSDFSNPSPCTCPCYTLTDCNGVIPPFNTISDLSTYVGQVIQIDENGGCNGPCFLVTLNTGPCTAPRTVTVTLGCAPCPPCNDCYVLVDCNTKQPYLTLSNPTANGVDLSTKIGQVIGQVCLGPNNTECTNGCWEIQKAQNCAASVSAYVYNIFQDCATCNAVCYKVTNCDTLQVIYITYTVPHPTLPNPSTLVGQTLGSLCFEAPTGCLTGCWLVELNTTTDCPSPVNWTTVVSYTQFANCAECKPKCYLLTECAPAVSDPIVVNNDLSLYVGSVAKICNSQGVCHCYNVELAQSCDGAITIDNASASFTTCEECNSCDCPPGYTKVGDYCQKITTIPATQSPVLYTVAPGNVNVAYGSLGTRFYNNVSALPYPLTASGSQFLDAASVPVPFTPNTTGVWGGPANSRLNTVGIWTTTSPNPVREWIGFSQCIDIPQSGTYCIGIGGDDAVRLKLDGVLLAIASVGVFDFNYWHVFEVNLTAGTHVIVLEGWNAGGPAAFGAEIYNATAATLQGFTTATQVQGVTVFTTFTKRNNDSVFETGENSGYSCPPGYTYNNCGAPSCSLIETVPFVVCAPTYKVKDCAGIQLDVITNSDLSAYLTGTYKACINTQLQSPWPDGCYCVTVEQIPYQEGLNFPAVFNIPSYECCEDCLRVCYLLTDCQGALDPVIVCNDLANYVGKIIKITGCGDICWQVALATNCTNNIIFGGDIIEFDTCQDCLPPAPPAPVLELHPRRIKPGYFSPNCKIPLEYIENVNQTFAKQVYDSMLVSRYGITVCCDHDLPLWTNRKAILDYEMLIDPTLCKSSLCYCPKPCLVDVRIDLLLTCVAPAIISTQINLPCPAPVITNVVINYEPVSAQCNCYTITPLEQPIEMLYLDCCCVLQRVLIDNLQPISLCASTSPAIYPQPSSATVVLNGDCDASGPCNPPTCYCWKVANEGLENGTAVFDACCTGPFCTDLFTVIPPGQTVYSCAYNPPSLSGTNLTVQNMGPCGTYCGPTPPVCQCYALTLNDGGVIGQCEFSYTDCNGTPQTVLLVTGQTVYLCSQTTFTPMCEHFIKYDLVVLNEPCAPDGTCTPPPACVCYIVNIQSTDGSGCYIDYTPCGGAPVTQLFPDGPNYICSQVLPIQSPGVFCTVTIQSTPLNCGLGECKR